MDCLPGVPLRCRNYLSGDFFAGGILHQGGALSVEALQNGLAIPCGDRGIRGVESLRADASKWIYPGNSISWHSSVLQQHPGYPLSPRLWFGRSSRRRVILPGSGGQVLIRHTRGCHLITF
jgi:hypothetical protein